MRRPRFVHELLMEVHKVMQLVSLEGGRDSAALTVPGTRKGSDNEALGVRTMRSRQCNPCKKSSPSTLTRLFAQSRVALSDVAAVVQGGPSQVKCRRALTEIMKH